MTEFTQEEIDAAKSSLTAAEDHRQGSRARPDEYLPGTEPYSGYNKKKENITTKKSYGNSKYSGTSKVDDWVGSGKTAKRSWKVKEPSSSNASTIPAAEERCDDTTKKETKRTWETPKTTAATAAKAQTEPTETTAVAPVVNRTESPKPTRENNEPTKVESLPSSSPQESSSNTEFTPSEINAARAMLASEEDHRQGSRARPDEYLPGTEPYSGYNKKEETRKKNTYGANPKYSGTSRVDDWLGSGKTQKKSLKVKKPSSASPPRSLSPKRDEIEHQTTEVKMSSPKQQTPSPPSPPATKISAQEPATETAAPVETSKTTTKTSTVKFITINEPSPVEIESNSDKSEFTDAEINAAKAMLSSAEDHRQGSRARPDEYLPGTEPYSGYNKKEETRKKKTTYNSKYSGTSRVDDWLGSGKTQKKSWKVKAPSSVSPPRSVSPERNETENQTMESKASSPKQPSPPSAMKICTQEESKTETVPVEPPKTSTRTRTTTTTTTDKSDSIAEETKSPAETESHNKSEFTDDEINAAKAMLAGAEDHRQGSRARPDEYLPGTEPYSGYNKKEETRKKNTYGVNPKYSGTSRVDDWLGSGKTQKKSWKVKKPSSTSPPRSLSPEKDTTEHTAEAKISSPKPPSPAATKISAQESATETASVESSKSATDDTASLEPSKTTTRTAAATTTTEKPNITKEISPALETESHNNGSEFTDDEIKAARAMLSSEEDHRQGSRARPDEYLPGTEPYSGYNKKDETRKKVTYNSKYSGTSRVDDWLGGGKTQKKSWKVKESSS